MYNDDTSGAPTELYKKKKKENISKNDYIATEQIVNKGRPGIKPIRTEVHFISVLIFHSRLFCTKKKTEEEEIGCLWENNKHKSSTRFFHTQLEPKQNGYTYMKLLVCVNVLRASQFGPRAAPGL